MIDQLHTNTVIITSGRKYLDIDAYASMLAYRKLLRTLFPNLAIYAVSTALINESVPQFLLNFDYQLDTVAPKGDEDFIVLDVSNPEFFDTFVNQNRLIEVIDHHMNCMDYWREHDEIKTQIEPIGAVCTIIYEKYVETKSLDLLDMELCQLLAAGIIDNTLNLQAKITHERDVRAYQELLRLGALDESFEKKYLRACDETILRDFPQAILNDLKIEQVSPLLPENFGQLVMSSNQQVDEVVLRQTMRPYDDWIFNLIALDDGKSYIYYSGEDVPERLAKFLDIRQERDGLVVLDKFLLRKEIMKKAKEYDT